MNSCAPEEAQHDAFTHATVASFEAFDKLLQAEGFRCGRRRGKRGLLHLRFLYGLSHGIESERKAN